MSLLLMLCQQQKQTVLLYWRKQGFVGWSLDASVNNFDENTMSRLCTCRVASPNYLGCCHEVKKSSNKRCSVVCRSSQTSGETPESKKERNLEESKRPQLNASRE